MHEPHVLKMIVEIPKGSRNKYEIDHHTGEVFLDRMLFTATRYPADYGYIPETLAEDGDPLDALALVTEPTFPGCRVRIRPVGLLLMEDQGKADHKVIGIPVSDPMMAHVKRLEDLPPHLLVEIEHFFQVYKALEEKRGGVPKGPLAATRGFQGLDETLKVIARSHAAFVPGS
jgi:inorganic pyrophosphatase